MILVSAIETMVAVGPGDDKPECIELSQLVLDRVKGEPTHVHQLAHVAMLLWFRESNRKSSARTRGNKISRTVFLELTVAVLT